MAAKPKTYGGSRLSESPVDLGFATLLQQLFGRSYFKFEGVHEVRPFHVWKRAVVKVFKAIGQACEVNIDCSDELQKVEIRNLIQLACSDLRRVRKKEYFNVQALRWLIRIVFQLLGAQPDNWQKKIVNKPFDWELDQFRSITYLQTSKQKARVIRSLNTDHRGPAFAGADLKGDLRTPRGWVRAFRTQFPDSYAKTF